MVAARRSLLPVRVASRREEKGTGDAGIMDEWIEYLKRQKIDKDICYSIYHASFL
ncbi:hypothetical protein [Nostoc linckia]|uniref:hypothetical protein n=1 Tax=Nostoc linckia TaxID=92942 RepID=UPI0015D50AD0|nr:hypothetical protein [Nostoc linckia]